MTTDAPPLNVTRCRKLSIHDDRPLSSAAERVSLVGRILALGVRSVPMEAARFAVGCRYHIRYSIARVLAPHDILSPLKIPFLLFVRVCHYKYLKH